LKNQANNQSSDSRLTARAVETAAAVEIDKGGLRLLLLDDFHKLLGKASAKTLRLFHSYHSAADGGP